MSSKVNLPDRRPSALYLTFNVGFMAPTRELLFEVLDIATNMTAYGPGYTPDLVLHQGVEKFVAEHGPYDFIIADEYVLQSFNMEDPAKNRFKNHACRFDRGMLIHAKYWRDF